MAKDIAFLSERCSWRRGFLTKNILYVRYILLILFYYIEFNMVELKYIKNYINLNCLI